MKALVPRIFSLAHIGFGKPANPVESSQITRTGDRRARNWRLALGLLLLISVAPPTHAAELRIGSAQGYPGDTVEIMLSLQGDGVTSSATFYIESSWVASFTVTPATILAPGATCEVDGSRFRVNWNGNPNSNLVDLCTLRMTIFNTDPRYNGAIFGRTQLCFDAGLVEQPCSISSGFIDVVNEVDRAFIAVLRAPPVAPSAQEVVNFDYANLSAAPPLDFLSSVRPQHVRSMAVSPQTDYSVWLTENPHSPITRLHERGVRFTFATLEEREQALVAAREDPAVFDIVDSLGLMGPKWTYPTQLTENHPFGIFLVGPGCPLITIATPGSRSIEVDGNQIRVELDSYYPGQVCFGVADPGYSGAVIEAPGLAAGTYHVSIETAAGETSRELVVLPGDVSVPVPHQIPNPHVRWWLILGVLLLAAWRLSTPPR